MIKGKIGIKGRKEKKTYKKKKKEKYIQRKTDSWDNPKCLTEYTSLKPI